jgi:hypothetical protein
VLTLNSLLPWSLDRSQTRSGRCSEEKISDFSGNQTSIQRPSSPYASYYTDWAISDYEGLVWIVGVPAEFLAGYLSEYVSNVTAWASELVSPPGIFLPQAAASLYDDVSISGGMIHDWWTREYLEGTGRYLIEILSWNFAGGTEENHSKPVKVH